ncbi:MAG: moeA 3 [Firmicutes bacterium]|nr:moeA 3 [Bacillota bacterium]
MKTGISLEEAQTMLLDLVGPVKECRVPLDQAGGKVLCQDIWSDIDLPPFDKSPLDGYALRAKDTVAANLTQPTNLEVIEEVRAGYTACKEVAPGTAIKVLTGAPIPTGADVVIKFEDVDRDGNKLKVFSPLKAGSNIIRAGEDVNQGEIIAKRGTMLNPPLVGLLASIGVDLVPVFGKVKVAILSTGDELLDPSEKLSSGKIYNSNLHSISAYCSRLGTEPIPMGIAPDEEAAIVECISRAFVDADLVITTGGVSVGDFDIVPMAINKVGAEVLFWKLDMKPGSPLIAGRLNNKIVIGLSGNPAAALITFELVVVPLIKKMIGFARQLPPRISATLADDFNKPSGQRRFLRAELQHFKDSNYVKLTGEQSNGVLKSMIECNALIDVPAGSGPLLAGQEVIAILIQS